LGFLKSLAGFFTFQIYLNIQFLSNKKIIKRKNRLLNQFVLDFTALFTFLAYYFFCYFRFLLSFLYFLYHPRPPYVIPAFFLSFPPPFSQGQTPAGIQSLFITSRFLIIFCYHLNNNYIFIFKAFLYILLCPMTQKKLK